MSIGEGGREGGGGGGGGYELGENKSSKATWPV